MESICVVSRVKESEKEAEKDKEKEGKEKREGARSRSSSTSSEDYIIILPDCFDTSRPLGESMYRYVPELGSNMASGWCESFPLIPVNNSCPVPALLCPSLVTSQPRAPQTQTLHRLTTQAAPLQKRSWGMRMKPRELWWRSYRAQAAPTTCFVRLRHWTMSRWHLKWWHHLRPSSHQGQ